MQFLSVVMLSLCGLAVANPLPENQAAQLEGGPISAQGCNFDRGPVVGTGYCVSRGSSAPGRNTVVTSVINPKCIAFMDDRNA
ncbi:hypothetical protein E4U53_004894 [Claviceps sorghi]|nr:hypothetical protein E4U53_004894 [Claviceps sorghi]